MSQIISNGYPIYINDSLRRRVFAEARIKATQELLQEKKEEDRLLMIAIDRGTVNDDGSDD